MFQRHPFSIVSCFRRFVSRDKISQYFDRFICQRLYYDAEIALNDLKKSDLKMSALNVRTTYHIYYFTFKLYFFVIHFFVTFNHLKNISHTDQFWFHRLL